MDGKRLGVKRHRDVSHDDGRVSLDAERPVESALLRKLHERSGY